MKRIYLTQDQVTLVDDEDYEWLNQWKWNAHYQLCNKSYYAERNKPIAGGKYRTSLMHREVLGLGFGDKRQGDHIHHNTLDNRRSQLRIVTHQQNQWNVKGVKGYSFHKRSNVFQAEIVASGKQIYLGSYNTPKEASDAYVEAKKKYHLFPKPDENSLKPEKNKAIFRHKPLF